MKNANEPQSSPTTPKPVVYACSGCSDAGELADRVARQLHKRGVAEMSCLAGIGGTVKPLMMKAQKAPRIVVVDGCPLNCARHTLLKAGLQNFQHIQLHQLGHRKGDCPVTEERVASASDAAADLVAKAGQQQLGTPEGTEPLQS
jgi:uncharacterized metal-binding protein